MELKPETQIMINRGTVFTLSFLHTAGWLLTFSDSADPYIVYNYKLHHIMCALVLSLEVLYPSTLSIYVVSSNFS